MADEDSFENPMAKKKGQGNGNGKTSPAVRSNTKTFDDGDAQKGGKNKAEKTTSFMSRLACCICLMCLASRAMGCESICSHATATINRIWSSHCRLALQSRIGHRTSAKCCRRLRENTCNMATNDSVVFFLFLQAILIPVYWMIYRNHEDHTYREPPPQCVLSCLHGDCARTVSQGVQVRAH